MSFWSDSSGGSERGQADRNPLAYINDRNTASSCYSDSSNSSRTGARRETQATYGNQRRIYFFSSSPASGISQGDIAETPGRGNSGQKLFFGSAHIGDMYGPREIHPCALGRFPSGIFYHKCLHASRNAPFTLLPFNPTTMELVVASSGRMPTNRRPVEGGYDSQGNTLYHGVVFSQLASANGGFELLAIPGEVIPARPGVQVRMVVPFKRQTSSSLRTRDTSAKSREALVCTTGAHIIEKSMIIMSCELFRTHLSAYTQQNRIGNTNTTGAGKTDWCRCQKV